MYPRHIINLCLFKKLAFFAAFFAFFICVSCSPNTKNRELGYEKLHDSLQAEQDNLDRIRERERRLVKREPVKKPEIPEPVIPTYNPLEETEISISTQNQPLNKILYVIAENAGLNLVVDPSIDTQRLITVNFKNTPSNLVLEKILGAYDLHGEVSNNILHIKRYVKKIFELDFLNTRSDVDINAGGNVLGNRDPHESNTKFSGNFQIKSSLGKGNQENSLYYYIQENIRAIMGLRANPEDSDNRQSEYFSLNPVTGTLYVRTTPGKMMAITKTLDKLKNKLMKQVVIDARIIEVKLKDDFRLGIDWSYVTKRLVGDKGLSVDLSWDSDKGEMPVSIIRGESVVDAVTDTFSSTISALDTFGSVTIVSSPHVRVKHGQPALFTSGSSQNYVSGISENVSSDNNNRNYSVTTDTLFDGIMLGVVPFITSRNKIDLQVFPVKSQIAQDSLKLQDITGDGDKISLPKVEVKNISTNVSARNHDTIILGGLIDKNFNMNDKHIPHTSDIPILNLFTGTTHNQKEMRELVIIMNIKVVE